MTTATTPAATVLRPATPEEVADRRAAYDLWKARFDAVTQLAELERDLIRLGYLTPSRAHYQRAAHRLPLPPCWTCGGDPIGRFPDGSALYRHYHASGTEPYVLTDLGPTSQRTSTSQMTGDGEKR